MPSPDGPLRSGPADDAGYGRAASFIAMGILVVMGVGLALGNLYYTAERSTIPLGLEETVVAKEIGREHAAGVDDVHFLWFAKTDEAGEWRLHVDRDVFEAIAVEDRITKRAWSRRLSVGGRDVGLALSGEFWGMVWVMSLVGGVLVGWMCWGAQGSVGW